MRYIPPVNEEERLFVSRLKDLARQATARHTLRFSKFLNLREKSLSVGIAQGEKRLYTAFYGGFDTAERVIFGIGEEEINFWDFPIERLDFIYKGESEISHRDVLGAVLGLGIARENVGDIFVQNNAFCIFALSDIAHFISSNLTEVGRERVIFTPDGADISFKREFEELTDTLASNRLDNVVSALMNTSRSKATEVINRGFVSVNHLAVTKTDFEIEEGDILSLRGGGRFIADSLSDKSRKGRIIFKYRKFI